MYDAIYLTNRADLREQVVALPSTNALARIVGWEILAARPWLIRCRVRRVHLCRRRLNEIVERWGREDAATGWPMPDADRLSPPSRDIDLAGCTDTGWGDGYLMHSDSPRTPGRRRRSRSSPAFPDRPPPHKYNSIPHTFGVVADGAAVDVEVVQLPNLETFSKAAELSSFTGAGKALGLTQAAVSQRIQTLEKSLGKSLFDRKGGRVLLTEAGQKLYAYAQRIIDLHREARRDITGHEASVAGELEIAASSIPGEHLLPALLSVFGQKYPHVRVRAAVSDSMAVMGQVERGEVSVGLVGRKADGPNFEFKYLTSDRMVLVAPPGHTLTKFKQITVGQLAAHPLVLREAGSGLRHCFEKALDRVGRSMTELRVALELGSNEAIKEALHLGVGVAVMSALAVQREIKSGTLHALDVEGISCDREMFVVQDRRRVPPISARLFLSFLDAYPVPDLPS